MKLRASDRSGGESRKTTAQSRIISASDRLLRLLAADGAFATAGEFAAGDALDVFSSRKGISLRTGSAAAGDVAALVSAGLAVWKKGRVSGRRRLQIADAGRARLARLAAGQDVDPFLAQHNETGPRDVEAGGITRRVMVDHAESPLARLAMRRNASGEPLLAPALFEAGERLRRDLTFAQMTPRVSASWDPALAGGERHAAPLTYSDIVLAARQRVDNAMRAVGPQFSGLLMDVCGFLKGLELIESERQWPRRSARLALGFALEALARHYGIETQARGPEHARGIRHWGADDYRPLADPPEKG